MGAMECPSDDVLERFAAGDAPDEAVARHLQTCAACRSTIQEIEANNAFLDSYVPASGSTAANQEMGGAAESEPLVHLGLRDTDLRGYRIESIIRRGGQGVVYRATHLETNRQVAVKMLRDDGPHTRRRNRRFEREIEIAASLRHPNIVMLYGTERLANGRVAFAMEYVDGLPLDEWARGVAATGGSSPAIRTKLAVFLQICDAVQHAHAHGIIHRDLKPSNILIDAEGSAHVLDFGVAKSIHIAGDVSQTGEFVGTPAYAAPEQLDLRGEEIDTRVDVYALGVNLYEMLTGRYPYRIDGPLAEVVREITQVAPRRPSLSFPEIDGELEAIVLKALVKERDRRYQTVQSLREDLRRYLAGEPVEARGDSAWYLLRKTAHRHRIAVVGMLTALVLLAGFAGAMTYLYSQKRNAEAEIRDQLRLSDIQRGRTESAAGGAGLAADLLWRAQLRPEVQQQGETPHFGGAIEPLDSYWALWDHYSRHPCVRTIDARHAVRDSAFSPDGQLLATVGPDARLKLWSMPDLRLLREFEHEDNLIAVRFSRDGRTLTTVSSRGMIICWDVVDGVRRTAVDASIPNTQIATISSDGRAAMLIGDDTVIRIVVLSDPPTLRDLDRASGVIKAVALSDGGEYAAVSHVQSDLLKPRALVRVWSVADPSLVAETVATHGVYSLVFAPDERSLYLAEISGEIERWSFVDSSSKPSGTFVGSGMAREMCWLHDGRYLATIGVDQVIQIWDSRQQHPLRTFSGQEGVRFSLAGSRERTALVSGSSDETICLWDVGFKSWRPVGGPDVGPAHCVAFSPDGRTLAFTGNKPNLQGPVLVRIDSPDEALELMGPAAPASTVGFSRDGELLAAGSYDGSVSLWNVADGAHIETVEDQSGAVICIAFSPTADILASGGGDSLVRLRDLSTGRSRSLQGHIDRISSLAFDPTGETLASASIDGTVRLWDVATGKPGAIYTPHGGRFVRAVCFSPSGLLLASGGDDNHVAVTDLQSGRHEVLRGHSAYVFSLAFGANDRVLISGDRAGNLVIWDVRRRQQFITLEGHADMLMGVAVSPDGMMLASCSAGFRPEVRLWDMGGARKHIAGNLEHNARRVAASLGHEPANLQAMREWAATLESHP